MEENKELFKTLFEKSEDFGRTSLELLKLKAIDKSSDFLSIVISRTIQVIFILTLIFLFTFGLSLWVGELTGKVYYGFFIVGAFYGLIAIAVSVFYKPIRNFISNIFIRQIMK